MVLLNQHQTYFFLTNNYIRYMNPYIIVGKRFNIKYLVILKAAVMDTA